MATDLDIVESLRSLADDCLIAGPGDLADAADEIERLRSLLVEANDAFDECAGNYSVELVHDEPWREFRSAEVDREQRGVQST